MAIFDIIEAVDAIDPLCDRFQRTVVSNFRSMLARDGIRVVDDVVVFNVIDQDISIEGVSRTRTGLVLKDM